MSRKTGTSSILRLVISFKNRKMKTMTFMGMKKAFQITQVRCPVLICWIIWH